MAFSATDAALEGFRIGRHHPKVMLVWALASLVISLVSSVLMVAMFGDTMSQLIEISGSPTSDPTEMLGLVNQMVGLYAVLVPIAVLIFAVFTGAVYRAVLRPENARLAYLRLGATELRLAVVIIALWAMMFVGAIVLSIVVGIVGAVLGAVLGASGAGGGVIVALLIALIYLSIFAGLFVFTVKFSMAAPMTFAEGRIRIFESWSATRGHFWPLLGAYILAFVLGLMVSFLGSAIAFAVMMMLGGGSAGSIDALFRTLQADYTSLQTFFSAPMIANLVISSFFSALTYAIFLAPPAVAYRDIVGDAGRAG